MAASKFKPQITEEQARKLIRAASVEGRRLVGDDKKDEAKELDEARFALEKSLQEKLDK